MTQRKRVAVAVHGLVETKWLVSLKREQGTSDDMKTGIRRSGVRRGVDVEALARFLLDREVPNPVVRYGLLNDCRRVSRPDSSLATQLINVCSDPFSIPYDILQ